MREAVELSVWAANFKGQFKSYVPDKNEEKDGEEINYELAFYRDAPFSVRNYGDEIEAK